MQEKLNNLYRWWLYYPYLLFFVVMECTDSEESGIIGKIPNGTDVYATCSTAVLKIFGLTVFEKKFCIKAARYQDQFWYVRFISEKDYFAYKLGTVEEQDITDLVRMRLI